MNVKKKGTSVIGPYVRSMAKHSRLTADGEAELAILIADLRLSLWSELLRCGHACSDAMHSSVLRMVVEKDPSFSGTLSPKLMADLDLDGDFSSVAVTLVSDCQECSPRIFEIRARMLRAKGRFVAANLRLVVTIAHRYNHGQMNIEDLIQEGNIGLMRAVDRFDGTRGLRFSTYATWWIRHAIGRAIDNKARTVRLPSHVVADLKRLRRMDRKFEEENGRRPNIEELSEETQLSVTRIRKIIDLSLDSTISTDAPFGYDNDEGLLSLLGSDVDDVDASPEQALQRESVIRVIRDAMVNLKPVEVDILCLRFGIYEDARGETLTLQEIANRYSLSRERIRQLQRIAMDKLKDKPKIRELYSSN